jgi:hypothetical protein
LVAVFARASEHNFAGAFDEVAFRAFVKANLIAFQAINFSTSGADKMWVKMFGVLFFTEPFAPH